MTDQRLPYLACDADIHYELSIDTPERITPYVDAKVRDEVATALQARRARLAGGSGEEGAFHMPGADAGGDAGTIPGSGLVKMNPLTGLSDEERARYLEAVNEERASWNDRDERLSVMDRQGIEAAVVYGSGLLAEHVLYGERPELVTGFTHAANRMLYDNWGFTYKDRLFVPPVVSLIDVDAAVRELEWALDRGARTIMLWMAPAYGRSPASPYFDPFWARVNEAGARITMHLGYNEYSRRGEEWGEPAAEYFHYTAFQWINYWCDRPAMEWVSAAIFHGLFDRHPNVRVLMSEVGTVWVPYWVRKMDHAFFMGRKGTYTKLSRRPSETFRHHFLVMPFPEENVYRTIETTGVEPIVFGSDFPHAEGLPDPLAWVSQIKNLSEDDQKRIMRDNLAGFLGLAA